MANKTGGASPQKALRRKIRDQAALAAAHVEAGSYFGAARVLRSIASEVDQVARDEVEAEQKSGGGQ